jgi:hypothetical protein
MYVSEGGIVKGHTLLCTFQAQALDSYVVKLFLLGWKSVIKHAYSIKIIV